MLTPAPLQRELCRLGSLMWQRGFCAGNDGNLSARLSEDRILCTPTGISKGLLRPSMICLTDMDGTQINKSKFTRTSEVQLHLALYKKRPDIRGIVHAHAPHATAFALAGLPLPRGIYPEAEVCLGHVPLVPYTKAGYKTLGTEVARHIDDGTCAALMANHGVVTFAATPLEAFYKLEMVNAYCQILLLLKQIGHVSLLSAEQMNELLLEKQKMGLPDSRTDVPLRHKDQPFLKGLKMRGGK